MENKRLFLAFFSRRYALKDRIIAQIHDAIIKIGPSFDIKIVASDSQEKIERLEKALDKCKDIIQNHVENCGNGFKDENYLKDLDQILNSDRSEAT